ncbi:23S rRNA (adenine(2503)-C(2))-methyltransferase RlmN [Emcibacter sp. SYSU 3D8]|uniref:23S rRNA (adenine(2503)-C(2))-methyltransferase RlmN n=1 Tax=Emcibacter sp. SYSU 3D8 TaxID=3133969 RepID=UPI0031FE6BB8
MLRTLNTPETSGKSNLCGLSRDELRAALAVAGVPEGQTKMRAQQLWHWIYNKGATSFDVMTNVSKDMRATLEKTCEIRRPEVSVAQLSEDGTRKWLVRLDDGNEVEAVFIPEDDRGTLCVSSQVGCTLTCKFCHTGTQRLVRNLTAAEIVGQVLIARDALGEWPSPSDGRLLSNIVLMGMGEPLYNFDNVKQAMKIVMDPEGISLSKRRITLSTSGVVPMMQRCGEEIGVNLAVSLHAVRDETRDAIMPINNKYPLKELLTACANYHGVSNARRITFEYAMLKGVNDSLEDAQELVRLLKKYDIPAKVNLIPFNPWPGTAFECSDWDTIHAFSEYVFNAGISAPIRMPRGRDIMAACGQLKSASEKIRKADLPASGPAATSA